MKFLLHIWKKLLGIAIIFISIIIILNEKSTTKMIVQKTDEKILSCQREIESLATQLTVINKHRKKLDEKFIEQKTELNSEIQDLKLTIKTLKDENYQLKEKNEKCSNNFNNNNNDKNNVIEKIPVINKNNDKNITGEILQLKEKNVQQENEIIELKEQLNQRIKNETSGKHSINQGRSENEINNNINNEVDPLLHPNEEHKGYADGENVHFHRKLPASADLEFKRGKDGEKINLPQILAPKELFKKLKEKEQQKLKKDDGTENDELKNDGREEVVDYQSIKKPNKEENDYKEMGE